MGLHIVKNVIKNNIRRSINIILILGISLSLTSCLGKPKISEIPNDIRDRIIYLQKGQVTPINGWLIKGQDLLELYRLATREVERND